MIHTAPVALKRQSHLGGQRLRAVALANAAVIPEQVQDWKIGDAAAVRQALRCGKADVLADEALAKLIEQPRFPHPRLPHQTHDVSLTALDPIEHAVQQLQLALSADKGAPSGMWTSGPCLAP